MTNEEIDKILLGESSEILQAHSDIIKIQYNSDNILKLGIDHLDHFLIDGLTNKMVFIGSRPSMGKTTSSETIIKNLLESKSNISILRMNLEMPTRSLLLRDYKKALNSTIKNIISKPFSEQEKPIIQSVIKRHNDKRVKNFSFAVNGEKLRYLLNKFCETVSKEDEVKNAEKEDKIKTEKICIIDHLHIYSTKSEIDEVLKICNEVKMKDSYLSFIIYFQFNRSLEDVWRGSKDIKANPKSFLPNSSHIYNTDTLMQFGSIVMGMTIPQVVDLEEFVSVYKERNQHLKEHFIDDIFDNTTVRLKGRNRIYYNYIKIRDIDDMEDSRLYCDILNSDYEKTLEKEIKKPTIATPIFTQTPIFEPLPNLSSFEKSYDELKDNSPF